MEWVETVAKTLAEAREMALDRLGVGEDDAEFEILEEPKPGLFGRVRGEARVRARVRPTAVRPKQDRRSRGRNQRSETPSPQPALVDAAIGRDPHMTVVGHPVGRVELQVLPSAIPPEAVADVPPLPGQHARRARPERLVRESDAPRREVGVEGSLDR